MATGRKRKKPPTRKQLAARRKFVAMVRRKSREARARKRNASKASQANRLRLSLSGRTRSRAKRKASSLKGFRLKLNKPAAKKRVVRRATKSPARRSNRGVLLSGRKRTVRRRRNQSSEVAALREAFPGVPMSETVELIGPDSAPTDVVPMGDLIELETSKETLSFEEGEAALGVDAQGKLHVLWPALSNPDIFDSNETLGTLETVTYGADKGDGSGYQHYEHIFGEEGGAKPKLETDREGMLEIKGGSYHLEEIFSNRRRNRKRRVTRPRKGNTRRTARPKGRFR